MLYNAIVLPYFDYSSPLWDNCGNTLKNRLQKFQNRPARVITGKSYGLPSVELLANLQWTSLETRRINSKFLFVYEIINGHTAPNSRNKFRFDYETEYPYNLRNSSTDLALSRNELKMAFFDSWDAVSYLISGQTKYRKVHVLLVCLNSKV